MAEIFLHDLRPAAGSRKAKKRVGRGEGSGLGKTSGRGAKGQKSRAGGQVPARFEGGQMPLHMRLPKLRGPNAKTAMAIGPFRTYMTPVNLSRLAVFAAGETVSPETLFEKGILKKLDERYKVLGGGDLDRPLVVRAYGFSASAQAKIEATGGSAELL
jgi:large subunit ribosomal protein L15